MSAVLAEFRPQGLGHELLLEWAPWARDDSDGERHSWALKPRVDPGYHGDPPPNFWVVDKIVAPHRRDKSPYWLVCGAFYLGERAEWEIAKTLGWSEQRVLMNLAAFCCLIEREYLDARGSMR